MTATRCVNAARAPRTSSADWLEAEAVQLAKRLGIAVPDGDYRGAWALGAIEGHIHGLAICGEPPVMLDKARR